MYYHAQIRTTTDPSERKHQFGLAKSEVESQIVLPYRENRVLNIQNGPIHPRYIEEIKIVQTDDPIHEWAEKRMAGAIAEAQIGGPSATIVPIWHVFKYAPDVTAQFLPELHQESTAPPLATEWDHTASTLMDANRWQEVIKIFVQAFPSRRKIEALLGQAFQLRLEEGLEDPAEIFQLILLYCAAQGKAYLAYLLNMAAELQPRQVELTRLRARLVDHGVIPKLLEKTAPQKDDERVGHLDETIPGGRFVVGGEYVNAHGDPIDPPPRYSILTLALIEALGASTSPATSTPQPIAATESPKTPPDIYVVNPVHEQVHFVLVTALEEERDALLRHLPHPQRLPSTLDDVRVYYQADFPVHFLDGTQGSYRIVLLLLLNYSRVEAANATNDAIRRWQPHYVLRVGIVGGIEAKGIQLGDVLVPDEIVDYEHQKTLPEESKIHYSIYRADPRLIGSAQALDAATWQTLVTVAPPLKGISQRRHIGLIVTDDKSFSNAEMLAPYQVDWPKLIGVDMGSGGIARAAFQAARQPRFFMVGAVSDNPDIPKQSLNRLAWRAYACEVAAAYTVALLQQGPIPHALLQNGTDAVGPRTNNLTTLQAHKQAPIKGSKSSDVPASPIRKLLQSAAHDDWAKTIALVMIPIAENIFSGFLQPNLLGIGAFFLSGLSLWAFFKFSTTLARIIALLILVVAFVAFVNIIVIALNNFLLSSPIPPPQVSTFAVPTNSSLSLNSPGPPTLVRASAVPATNTPTVGEPATPTSISASTAPISIRLAIKGNESSGQAWTAPEKGSYTFHYVEGEYSIGTTNGVSKWFTTLRVYRGKVQVGVCAKDDIHFLTDDGVQASPWATIFTSDEQSRPDTARPTVTSTDLTFNKGDNIFIVPWDDCSKMDNNLGTEYLTITLNSAP